MSTVLTDEQIEQGRESTFSTNNPYCPCDSKTMRKAARWAEQAVLQSPEVQAWKRDSERIRALAREFDRARRGSGDSYMPIWDALCESIGRDDDGDEMLAAIDAAMEKQP